MHNTLKFEPVPKLPHSKIPKLIFLLPYLVINIAVCEHCVEVLHTLACTPVVHILQSFLDGPHVHWFLYYFVIVLDAKGKQKVIKS